MTYDPLAFYSPVTVAVEAFVRVEWPLNSAHVRTMASILCATRYKRGGLVLTHLDADETTMETIEHMVCMSGHNHDV